MTRLDHKVVRAVLALGVTSCGRIGFDHSGAPDGGRVDAAVDPDLLAWWPLEGPPPVAVDAVGHHDGTCTGAGCPTTGSVGGRVAWTFDGIDDAVRVPHDPALVTPAFTVACWFRVASLPGRGSLVGKPFGNGAINSWQLSTDPDGALVMVTTDGAANDRLVAPASFQPGVWVHVAGSFDGMTKRLFVDGVPLVEQNAVIATDGSDVLIGADENAGALAIPFPGPIADVRLYRRALAGPEVAALAAP